jgi:uncharacterized membrane protein (UPF0182 family)
VNILRPDAEVDRAVDVLAKVGLMGLRDLDALGRMVGDAEGSDGGYPVLGTSDTQDPEGAGIRVDEPRIYYGQLTTDYAIAGGTPGQAPGEYDTANDRDYLYSGEGGVPIDSWFNRLVFGAFEGERNILFSSAISEGAKIMHNRDPAERVSMVAPWLTTDGDPYPAVIDGRIKWIVDGYTTLNNYPYSQRTQLGEVVEDAQVHGQPRDRRLGDPAVSHHAASQGPRAAGRPLG